MSSEELDILMDRLIGEIAQKVQPQGFVRRKRTLRAAAGGNVALMDFQKSDQSSARRLVFTVNLGVVCGALISVNKSELERVDIVDSHLRTRMGMLLELPSDKWWEIIRTTDLTALRDELLQDIFQTALPYLRKYLDTDALIELWRSGKSPGLTATQRSRFLAALENVARN